MQDSWMITILLFECPVGSIALSTRIWSSSVKQIPWNNVMKAYWFRVQSICTTMAQMNMTDLIPEQVMPKWMADLKLQTVLSNHNSTAGSPYEYTVCIPQQEHHPHPDPLLWTWYTPCLKDFNILSIATSTVSMLNQEKAVGIIPFLLIVSDQ